MSCQSFSGIKSVTGSFVWRLLIKEQAFDFFEKIPDPCWNYADFGCTDAGAFLNVAADPHTLVFGRKNALFFSWFPILFVATMLSINFLPGGRVLATARATFSHLSTRFFSAHGWRQAFLASIVHSVNFCFCDHASHTDGCLRAWPVHFLTGDFHSSTWHRPLSFFFDVGGECR